MPDRLVFKNQLMRDSCNFRQVEGPSGTFPIYAMWTRYGGGVMVCTIQPSLRLWGEEHDLTQADVDAHPGLLEALAWTFGFRPLELMP